MKEFLFVLFMTILIGILLSYSILITFASHQERIHMREVKSQTTKKSMPTPKVQPETGVLLTEEQKYIIQKINNYRTQNGLSNVIPDKYTCDFAKVRAWEISGEFNHEGFRKRTDSHSLPYPGYALVTENLASSADYKKVVTLWIGSAGHAQNMRKNTPYVCVAKYGHFYAYEGRKP